MKKLALGLCVATFVSWAVWGGSNTVFRPSPPSLLDDVQDRLRSRLETALHLNEFRIGSEPVRSVETLIRFYESRHFKPYWTVERELRPQARQLHSLLLEVESEGLFPQDYHIEEIQRFDRLFDSGGRESWDAKVVADYEILMTDGFLTFGLHLLSGRVKPEDFETDWIAKPRDANLLEALIAADSSGDLKAEVSKFRPRQAAYANLCKALERYRSIRRSGGWKPVPAGAKLELGVSDPRVVDLRNRLQATADLEQATVADPSLFDSNLTTAVRQFQHRHGLDADGVVGPKTLEALNVSVEDRIVQIELNLERWRWLPEDLGLVHVIVNIAGFHLDVIEDDRVVLEMPVVVGRPYRRTPVFSDEMTYLVFNPYWNVPPNLARQDIVPKIIADPEYLSKERIRVFRGWGSDAEELDPATIDWKSVGSKIGAFRFRQDPGPANALGRVKFMFPNTFNVYLHDTPSRSLFARSERAFSSGCIRVGLPLELAAYLLSPAGDWTPERIEKVLVRGEEETVLLPRRVPIHLLYWTAWLENDPDLVHFRNDIYGRDARLKEVLQGRLPL
ncbi:MAG: L,D-transpeptidase family protein [Acidobacteriota bacterium]|nr:MAG: L,D-transpeptidase family protein [Acidobacteriota bacterium]